MKTRDKVLNLRIEGKTIPEICAELGVSKGTVGHHLRSLGIKWNGKRSEETKRKIGEAQKGKSKTHSKEGYQKYTPIPKENHKRNQEGYVDPKTKDWWSVLRGETQTHKPSRGSIRAFIIKHSIIPYNCSECGCDDNWFGKKMPLILDHINGINNDHILKNLRFLCSNCDAVQDTYKGRNKS